MAFFQTRCTLLKYCPFITNQDSYFKGHNIMHTFNRTVRIWSNHIFLVTYKVYHFCLIILQARRDSRFLLHCIGKVRRFLLVHFRQDYVQHQLKSRGGTCRQCGTCCNLLFTCPMLTKDGRCFAYGTCRPEACKVFPIDQRDIAEVKLCGHHCGYRFDMAKKKQ